MRERSCQENVYPCHSRQKSAMDEWITAILDCQGESSIRFDVFCRQSGSHESRTQISILQKRHFFPFQFCMHMDCVCVHRNVQFVQLL